MATTRLAQPRRRFLQTLAASGAAFAWPEPARAQTFAERLAAAARRKRPGPNDRPNIGIIGYGQRAATTAKEASRHGEIVAVADVDQRHLDAAVNAFPGATPFRDFRRLIDRKDLDVVINATPDHWHALINLHALAAGQDVYAEAPLTHTYEEGTRVVQAVKKARRILQTGLQLRSDQRYRLACEVVRNGRIGRLQRVVVGLPATAPQGGPFLPAATPAGLDWDLWLGPAPPAAYVAERCHASFRWWWDYSQGMLAEAGVHLLDIALWGAGFGEELPTTIEAQAHTRPVLGGHTAIARFSLSYTFENKLALTCSTESPPGVRFEGANGWVFIARDALTASDPKIIERPLLATARRLYASDDHMTNFFECVRSRRAPAAGADTGRQAAALCQLGVIALRLDRPLGWNRSREKFVNDTEADALLAREQRKPFTYEMLG